MGLDQRYTGRAGGSATGKGFNNIILTNSVVCPMWPACNEVARRVGGLEFDSGHNLLVTASFLLLVNFSF